MPRIEQIGVVKDKKSGLLLPFWRCGKCTRDKPWVDVKGKTRCWDCEPPHQIIRIMIEEKKARLAKEQRMVEEFCDEDDDIQLYNLRHFGVRTS